jgi:hypothetical protein
MIFIYIKYVMSLLKFSITTIEKNYVSLLGLYNIHMI